MTGTNRHVMPAPCNIAHDPMPPTSHRCPLQARLPFAATCTSLLLPHVAATSDLFSGNVSPLLAGSRPIGVDTKILLVVTELRHYSLDKSCLVTMAAGR